MNAPADRTLAEYLAELARRLELVDLRAVSGLAGRARDALLPLAEVYVQPRLTGLDEPAARKEPRKDLRTLITEVRCVVVTSEPGSGKSTLLRAVSLALARPEVGLFTRRGTEAGPKPPDGLVPVFLRLADFSPRAEHAGELRAFVHRQIAESFSPDVAAAVDAAHDRLLLCLDGLDEIPRDADRRRAARAIEAWARSGRCWVSVRAGFEPALAGPFVHFRIEPFNADEVAEYLERRAGLADESPASARGRAHALRADRGVAAMTGAPLLLVIALALGGEGHELPGERVRLYQRVFDTLVRSWNEDRRHDALQPSGERVDPGDLLRAWAEVAEELLAEGGLDQRLHRGALIRRLARRFQGPGSERCAAAALVILGEQAGLLERVDAEHVRFWHATFGEYLAAIGLARRIAAGRGELPTAARAREVVRLAVRWADCIDGDPRLADAMVRCLLDRSHGGGWSRVFGAGVRLAIDCLVDGHPADDSLYTLAVERALDEATRLPTRAAGDALVALVALRPDAAPRPDVASRLAALLAPPGRGVGARAPLLRWLSRVTDQEPAALACCESWLGVVHGGISPRHEIGGWAAVGLLRAGVVDDRVCRAIVESVGQVPTSGDPVASARGLAAELRTMEEVDRIRVGLRARLAAEEASANAAACVLALLGDDSPDVLDALWRGGAAKQSDAGCVLGIGWLARVSEPARALLAARVVGEDDSAVAAQKALAAAIACGDGQARAIGESLARAFTMAPDLADPDAVNRRVLRGGRGRRQPLREWLSAQLQASEAVAEGLLDAADGAMQWFAAAMVFQAIASSQPLSQRAAGILRASLTGPDPARTIVAAELMAARRPSAAEREEVVRAVLRSLSCETDRIHKAARSLLLRFVKECLLCGIELAPVVACLDAVDTVQAAAAAVSLRDVPALAHRCRSVLLRALAAEDTRRVSIAFHALRPDDEDEVLAEPLECAALRLVLSGELQDTTPSAKPRSRRIVETFLSAPLRREKNRDYWLGEWARCLAAHPDALELALAALPSAQDDRAARLLAATIDSEAAIERVIEATLGAGDPIVDAAIRALQTCADREGLAPAARRARLALLRDRLRSPELARVHAATCIVWSIAPEVTEARGRVLQHGDPALRLAQVAAMMASLWRESATDELATAWFGCTLTAVAAALRERVDELTLASRLKCGLLLRRLDGDSSALCAAARAVIDEASIARENDPEEDVSDVAWALTLPDIFDLDRSLMNFEPSSTPRRALLCLLDLDDSAAIDRVIRGCFVDGRPERSWHAGWEIFAWVCAHRAGWVARFEDAAVQALQQAPMWQVEGAMKMLRERGAVSPAIRAAAIARWPEHLFESTRRDRAELSAFIVGSESPPDELLATWRAHLGDAALPIRARAALALAQSGHADPAVVDELMDAFMVPAWRESRAAELAYRLLTSPAVKPLFSRRRRFRAERVGSGEEAFAVVEMWSAAEADAEPEIVVPLLRRAAEAADLWIASRSAFDLYGHDPIAATAALERVAAAVSEDERTLAGEAAAWLIGHGVPSGLARERLWAAVRMRASLADERCWKCAAAVLFALGDDRGALIDAMHVAVAEGEYRVAEHAVWLLAALDASGDLVLRALLERLARVQEHYGALDWFEALCRGQRPGTRPAGSLSGPLHRYWDFTPSEEELDGERASLNDQRSETSRHHEVANSWFRHGETLAEQAAGLAGLAEPLPPGLNRTMATMLGYDGSLEVLWTRLSRRELRSEDAAVVAAVVAARLGDSPGQRFARLWWLARLKPADLLEHEDGGAPATVPRQRNAMLAEILRAQAGGDPGVLRSFVASLKDGLADSLPGPTVSLVELADQAAALLLRDSLALADQAVRRASRLAAELRAAWDEPDT